MRLINQTKSIILAEEVSFASTPLKRIKGLLGRKDFHPQEALIIKPCSSIHTFFMRFTIDVVFLNKQDCVVKTISSIKPFRLSSIYFKAHYAIELPANTIFQTQTQINDIITIEY